MGDSICPLMEASDYKLHVFLKSVLDDPGAAMGTWAGSSPTRFCKMIWDARRKRNLELCILDESGKAQGWSAASRFVLVSSQIREIYKCEFLYLSAGNGRKKIHESWKRNFMVHAQYGIPSYDLRDLELAFRLLSRSWLSRELWKAPADEVYKLTEILLYDLNLRLEQILCELKSSDVLPGQVIRECVDTTALFHGMLLAYKNRVTNCVPITPNRIARWAPAIYRGAQWNRQYESALDRLREYLRTEFVEISKMGRLPENVAGFLRFLLLPLDIFSRYKAIENLTTESHIVASQRILSVAELNWIEFKMSSLKAEELLDAHKFRPEHAWIFEMASVAKLCNLLLCQYNVQFQWIANCFVCDRDTPRYTDEMWNRATQQRPCISTFGPHYYLSWRGEVFTSEDLYEIVLLWILITHSNKSVVRVSAHESYTLRREIEMLYNKCFPRMDLDMDLQRG
jgi:hypothetical protein